MNDYRRYNANVCMFLTRRLESCVSRQFELDLLAQRGELLMSEVRPGFCSAFRASNLQGALHLLEELRQAPISYKPRHHPPDNRGYSEYGRSRESLALLALCGC